MAKTADSMGIKWKSWEGEIKCTVSYYMEGMNTNEKD
jgi:hypothetical protein